MAERANADFKNNVVTCKGVQTYTAVNFDRDLMSVLHQPGAEGIRGVVIGRFQKHSEMDEKKIRKIISSKNELKGIPVIANVDFGHTAPYITFPVGGHVRIEVQDQRAAIHVLKH